MELAPFLQASALQYAALQKELEAYNAQTKQYGLALTPEGVQMLAERRQAVLTETDRVEFGRGILGELIAAFASSPHLSGESYEETLAELQDIFYRMKGEADEGISDADLVDALREAFDNSAQGSLEILENMPVAKLFELVRAAGQDADEDWSEQDAYEEKEEGSGARKEIEEDESGDIDRVHDKGRFARPGNFYAGLFYDDYTEQYTIIGDFDGRIGGSSLG